MKILGKQVILRPFSIEEKALFYQLTCQSDATEFLFGELYQNSIPNFKQLFLDYKNYYFDGSKPKKGRCFKIIHQNKTIGQINYNEIIPRTNTTELDIWISKKVNWGKGLGTDALLTICPYLNEYFEIKEVEIIPLAKNKRAINSYQKAGFQPIESYFDKNVEYLRMKKNLIN